MKHSSKNRRKNHRLKIRLAMFTVATATIILVVRHFADQHEAISSVATSELLYALFDKGIDVLFFGR